MYKRLYPALILGAGILLGVIVSLGWGAYSSMAQTSGGCQTFSQTGHKVCGRFLEYWNSHGGLAQQGYPLSEEFVETSALNGRPYTVQYFERAVFEMHPENKAPNDVLLSQLGTFMGKQNYSKGFPTSSGDLPFYENRTTAVGTLKSFYNAVNRKEYDRAYSYFDGAPNPAPSLVGPFTQFVQGYKDTASVTLAVGKETGDAGAGNIYSSMPVVITAMHTDKSKAVFSGCYTLHTHSPGITPDPDAVLWRISAAQLAAAPAGASVDTLLAVKCGP